MDSATFEEMAVDVKVVGDKAQWLSEGGALTLVEFNDKIIEVVTPSPCVYTITETEPNMKGNTAQGYTKPAVLDCGATISVPGYLETGQKVRVDTEKGVFVERVNE
jgi:elongation factor P